MTTTALSKSKTLLDNSAFQITFASLMLALLAQVKIPLFFTPVPVTIQNITLLFLSAFLGPRKAFIATLCYLAYGICGLPVFAGGASGVAYFVGPTMGYLVAFPCMAYLFGKVFDTRFKLLQGVLMLIAFMIQYLFGAAYLSLFVGLKKAYLLGIAPFILGDLIKLGIATTAISVYSLFKNKN